MLFGFFFLVVQIAAIKAATTQPTPPPIATSAPLPCFLEKSALDSCLSGNNANVACQACLSGATDQLDPLETDTCYSLSTRVCTYLKNPSCLCPIEACAFEIQEYFGCYKEFFSRNLGCDDTLACGIECSAGGYVCAISDLMSSIIAALFSGDGGE